MLVTKKYFGFSYVEVIMAIALVSIIVLPLHSAIDSALKSYKYSAELTEYTAHLSNRVAELEHETYADLSQEAINVASPTVPTAYSDPVATPMRRLVYLSSWDGDNADADNDGLTGGDAGILWLRVEMQDNKYHLDTLVIDEN